MKLVDSALIEYCRVLAKIDNRTGMPTAISLAISACLGCMSGVFMAVDSLMRWAKVFRSPTPDDVLRLDHGLLFSAFTLVLFGAWAWSCIAFCTGKLRPPESHSGRRSQ